MSLSDGDRQTIEELRDRPLTFVLVMVLVVSVALGVISTFAFSDSADETLKRGCIAGAVVAALSCVTAIVHRRETRASFPSHVRRRVWWFILATYLSVLGVIAISAAILPGLADLRLLLGLLAMSPVAILAYGLIKRRKGEPGATDNPDDAQ